MLTRDTHFEQISLDIVLGILQSQSQPKEGTMPIRILLADSSEVVRQALVRFLKEEREVLLVGDVDNLADAFEISARLKPDVLLLDPQLAASRNGSVDPIMQNLRDEVSRIVAMSVSIDEQTRDFAAAIGASILLDKTNLSDELIPAILKSPFMRNSDDSPAENRNSTASKLSATPSNNPDRPD